LIRIPLSGPSSESRKEKYFQKLAYFSKPENVSLPATETPQIHHKNTKKNHHKNTIFLKNPRKNTTLQAPKKI